jgi:LssY-like putative type I secretion system component LssY
MSLPMRVLPCICRRLAPLAVVCCSALAFGCDGLAAGQTLWIRLSAPVSSYSSKPGDIVHAVLTEAVTCDNGVVFPVGTKIDGTVRSVRKVGWGIRHETAALDIRFDRAIVIGSPVTISASIVEVENAREQVTSKGIIQGIRSSDTPEGRINSRLIHLPTYNPYSDLGLIVYKATFPIFPEPEIYYPAGTDLRLKLKDSVPSLPMVAVMPAESIAETSAELDVERMAPSFPTRSTTVKLADADVVNLAFIGSREQVEAAFPQAGWSSSDPFSRHSFVHTFYAFLNDSTYDRAPMKTLLLDGRPADMSWQKSLNSYNRRDHLRMWQWSETSDSEIVWLSSSTHDTRATLSVKQHSFVHHIAPDIDDERSTVIRDLELAGCVKSLHLVPRRNVTNFTQNANGDTVRTDGELAIVQLKECQPVVPGLPSSTAGTNFKPGNHAFRYLRKQILTFRSDIWRANIIYGAYDLTRMTIETFRHHPTPPPTQEAQADGVALRMGGSK